MKDITCFVCCQVVKWHFAARALFCCLIKFLFLEIQMKGVKNSRHKSGTVYKPPEYKPSAYKPTKKCLWIRISLGLIFGVLQYVSNCKSFKIVFGGKYILHRLIGWFYTKVYFPDLTLLETFQKTFITYLAFLKKKHPQLQESKALVKFRW